MAAGSHFNPNNHSHACPPNSDRHAGDFGNFTANARGVATVDFLSNSISLTWGQANNVIGRAIIVHAGHDDCHSQPVGNSGGRIAQGVIGVAKP
jgi:Cu-Zn family superoxide dismutase